MVLPWNKCVDTCIPSAEAAVGKIADALVCSSEWELLSRVRLFATPRTTQSMEFSRPEHWNR